MVLSSQSFITLYSPPPFYSLFPWLDDYFTFTQPQNPTIPLFPNGT